MYNSVININLVVFILEEKSMLESSDFRRVARQSLRGKWLLAAGTGLIVTLLGGGISSNGSITFSA